MQSVLNYIQSKLEQRKANNTFRQLRQLSGLVDFTSNDYLGYARNEQLKTQVEQVLQQLDFSTLGSTGSRLLSGNSVYAESLETFLADFHQAESALLFNSGFDANYGLLSALPYRGDTIIYDELVHASIHDGIQKSLADSKMFAHNNTDALEQFLHTSSGLKYVVVESVYSMDGDFAPLKTIAALCEKFDAALIVDEAHATGIFGPRGEGRVVDLGLSNKCFARIHTFSKAIGAHGAAVVGSEKLKQFLINYSRPFIYSTALPVHTLVAIRCAYEYLQNDVENRLYLLSLIGLFKQEMSALKMGILLPSDSAIQSVLFSGSAAVKEVAAKLQADGFDIRPIVHPTVLLGKERIRICLHSFNQPEEIVHLAKTLQSL